MKHIKLFENINISHIKSTINEYYNFIELTTPIAFERYNLYDIYTKDKKLIHILKNIETYLNTKKYNL